MLNLQGVLSASDQDKVSTLTRLRFEESANLVTPEALILHEQRMLSDSDILSLCEDTYKMNGYDVQLSEPEYAYMPRDIINKFTDHECVPIRYNVAFNTIVVGVLPERPNKLIIVDNLNIQTVCVPLYYYVHLYTKYYGQPKFLLPIPVTVKADLIISEAVDLGASDITISTVASGASVYYKVRKKKVYSNRQIAKDDVRLLVSHFATLAGATIDMDSNDSKPRYFSVPLGVNHRGRVVVNKTYYGYSLTARVLSNDVQDVTLEDLNIAPSVATFIRKHMLDMEDKGLRLLIGETGCGKNTTTLAAISELVALDKYKIISLEQPVEILVDGIEQIDAETDDEFSLNADSLLRSAPDLLYFTEITARTAEPVLKASNTGKVVFSSIHANSISDVFSRLMDITGMPLDRLITTVQSCVYQELIRDEEKDAVFPVNRCIHFTEDLKYKLYGRELSEVKKILSDIEHAKEI